MMANSVVRANCDKWVHGRCALMKRATSSLAEGYICERCVEAIK